MSVQKIMERMTRGTTSPATQGRDEQQWPSHLRISLRQEEPTAPATLTINEEQAEVVRPIFEMFASGSESLVPSRAGAGRTISPKALRRGL